MKVRRLNDPDATALRELLRRYGVQGVAIELSNILRQWARQSPRYAFAAKSAARLAFAARLGDK